MQEINKIKPGPELYGFYKSPPLDTVTTWSENLSVPLPADSHKASLNLDSFSLLFLFSDSAFSLWLCA